MLLHMLMYMHVSCNMHGFGIAQIIHCMGTSKGQKYALFSIKCKGAVWKIKYSCEVNLFVVLVPQHIPKGENYIFA